jgi:two-component system sensor histidine kinase HydH
LVSTRTHIAGRTLLPLAIVALPLVLLLSSLRTFNELDEQRTVYLRHRVAVLAARLERVPPGTEVEALNDEEPNLAAVEIIQRGGASDAASLAPIWNGGELFRTGFEGDVFRAYVPYHSSEGLRIARLDLSAAAADFLIVHAWHNVVVATLGGLALVTLSIYSVWAMRRAARLQMRHLEMEHLAHIGKMSAMLAHEIRNPLGTIKGYAQLAGERAPEELRALLDPVLSETQRLELLVNDLLAYGRPPHPNLRTVDWTEIAATVEQHARHLPGERPVRIVIAGDHNLQIHTDPALLSQALLNLVRNAIEAIPAEEAGEVRIEAAASREHAVIQVTDTGTGIAAGAQSRLFEPFFTTKPFGTGLGLAITRKLVQSIGGELEIGPRSGGGTAAVIRLPRAKK